MPGRDTPEAPDAKVDGAGRRPAGRSAHEPQPRTVRETALVEALVHSLAAGIASGTILLNSWLRHLHRTFPRNLTWSALSGDSRLLRDNVGAHGSIRKAIEGRAPAEARELMKDHILRAGELVTMWFERQMESR